MTTSDLDLGSDHRAVRAQVGLPQKLECRPRREKKMHWFGSATYSATLAVDLATRQPDSIIDVEAAIGAAAVASGAVQKAVPQTSKPWDTEEELQKLRSDRLKCRDCAERRRLSKLVFTKTRRALRVWQTQRLRSQLESGRELSRSEQIGSAAVISKSAVRPSA